MGHGLPDWYRGVDIAYQALSEMIIRPKYGALLLATGLVEVAAYTGVNLCNISGKGVSYGGHILIIGAQPGTNKIKPYFDGNTVNDYNCLELMYHNIYGGIYNAVNILSYNNTGEEGDTRDRIYLVLREGYTFESSFRVNYYNADSVSGWVQYALPYALI